MSTPNLAIAHILQSQTQKEVTANAALGLMTMNRCRIAGTVRSRSSVSPVARKARCWRN